MKASTIFAITVALLLALGVAVSAKMAGLFDKKAPLVEEKQEPIKVLVAARDLYEGISIGPDMVTVRSLRPEELAHYQQHKSKYLPPVVNAAALRIPIKNIETDQPILRDQLEDLAFPESATDRLREGMRAVNLSLPKDKVAGGLITRGDYVDVLLTSSICDAEDCQNPITLSAYIARDVRVIVKRNTLWTVLAANPDDRPVAYTLEANPYRAALIEFAANKGAITLVPSPKGRDVRPTSGTGSTTGVSYASLNTTEYRDEDKRVAGILSGEYAVSEADLERIFQLQPIDRPVPPPPPIHVRHISGVAPRATAYFSPKDGTYLGAVSLNGGQIDPVTQDNNTPRQPKPKRPSVQGQKPLGYAFQPQGGTTGTKPGDCPTCGKK